MVLLKCVIFILIVVLIPMLIGELVVYRDNSDFLQSVFMKYMMGFFAVMSLFWILCLVMTFLKISFTKLCIVYSGCLVLLSIISICLCYVKEQKWKKKWKYSRPKGCEILYLILFVFLLGVQVYYSVFYDSTIWSYDDVTYVVLSQDTISSDHMYMSNEVTGLMTDFSPKRVLNSWPIYIAYLSKMTGFHVTTIAHTIIPAVFLLIGYGVYNFLATGLLKDREDRLIFLCILSVLFIFGFHTPYSLTFRFLITLWQGKAVLFAIVLPFLFAFLPRIYERKFYMRTACYLLITSMTACSLTMMGSGMTIAVCVVMWMVFSVCKRRLTGTWYCFWGSIIPAIQMGIYLLLR
ncbi:MAG: DUF6077 domain-containing protein [Lachnospiraceae bacterium]